MSQSRKWDVPSSKEVVVNPPSRLGIAAERPRSPLVAVSHWKRPAGLTGPGLLTYPNVPKYPSISGYPEGFRSVKEVCCIKRLVIFVHARPTDYTVSCVFSSVSALPPSPGCAVQHTHIPYFIFK